MDTETLLTRQEIEDLSVTYMRGLDRLDRELLRGVFHDDATADYGFFRGGPDEFVDMAIGGLRTHLANHHMLGQIKVWLDAADLAYGEVYFQAYHRIVTPGGEKDLFIAGRYVDRYRRRDGTWKISNRNEINDWSRTEPASDAYFERRRDSLRGARAPNDLSYRIRAAEPRG